MYQVEKSIDDSNKVALAQGWRSFMDYNPKNGILAMVTQLGEVIEIFNLKTGEHRVYYGPHGEPLFHISQGYGLPIGIMGFHDVKVTRTFDLCSFSRDFIQGNCPE